MTKARKPLPFTPAPKPLTKEEQAQQVARMLAQKKDQLFTGVLFAIVSNSSVVNGCNTGFAERLVDYADEVANSALKKLYNLPDEKEVAEK